MGSRASRGFSPSLSQSFLAKGVEAAAAVRSINFFVGRYLERCPRWLQHCYTLFFIAIGWALFAVEDFSHLGPYLSAMLGFGEGGPLGQGAVFHLGKVPVGGEGVGGGHQAQKGAEKGGEAVAFGLIPTQAYVWADKLPAGAPNYKTSFWGEDLGQNRKYKKGL